MSRERILRIVKILCEYTDREQGLTLHEIREKLNKDLGDGSLEEQRIRSDLELIQYMCDTLLTPYQLEVTAGHRNEYSYRLYRPKFGLDEARLVFDSVSTSKFLSDAQKRELLSQMEGFLSKREVQRLKERVYSRPSSLADSGLPRRLHFLYSAIQNKECIQFDYYKYNVQGKKQLEKQYRGMSPVRIKWSGEHYYLSAVNPEHGELHSYRIDRIRALEVDRGTWIFAEERDSGFRQFEMFEPQAQKTVIFRIHRKLIDMAVEVLGPGAVFQADEDLDWSRVSADVEISEGFYRWVLQQSGKLEVLAPESVRAEIKKRLKEMLARYSE